MLAASRVYGALDTPTNVVRDEMGTLASRQESKSKQPPSAFPIPNSPTSHGCYKAAGNMSTHTVENMSSGSCNKVCEKGKFPVSGLQASQCFCGMVYPMATDQVEDENCNYPCPSYPLEACGGLGKPGYWSVYNTGVNVNVGDYEPPSSSSSSPTSDPTISSKADSDPTAPAIVTQTRTATPSSEAKSGTNTAPIVAGSVAGVVAAALMIGGVFFFIRRRRNSEIEEEHRRNAAVNAFINGSKPPGSSGSMSMTDSRLNPVLAHRRMSDGSIADNEDYSRRILRVCLLLHDPITLLRIR